MLCNGTVNRAKLFEVENILLSHLPERQSWISMRTHDGQNSLIKLTMNQTSISLAYMPQLLNADRGH